jgi:hypothetical protein
MSFAFSIDLLLTSLQDICKAGTVLVLFAEVRLSSHYRK